jgi:hypothetical protein
MAAVLWLLDRCTVKNQHMERRQMIAYRDELRDMLLRLDHMKRESGADEPLAMTLDRAESAIIQALLTFNETIK